MGPPEATPPAFVRLAAHPVRWRLLTELARSDYRVGELVARLAEPQSLVSYHLRLLREGGLVTARRSSFDARDRYHHLDAERCGDALVATGLALHPALALARVPPRDAARRSSRRPSVLFACTGNSARSPIAAALTRHLAGDRVDATSAGSHPRPELHPHAVRVLREGYGIDVSGQRPTHLDATGHRSFDRVVSLCDRVREVRRPEFLDPVRSTHWSIADPASGDYAAFRRLADDIETRVRHLLPSLTDTTDREVQP